MKTESHEERFRMCGPFFRRLVLGVAFVLAAQPAQAQVLYGCSSATSPIPRAPCCPARRSRSPTATRGCSARQRPTAAAPIASGIFSLASTS